MMQAEQVDFGFDAGHDQERARSYEFDPTPAGVVAQGYQTIATRLVVPGTTKKPLRILDPCAGSGVFGQQAKLAYPRSHTTGIELRPEEWPWLQRNYDDPAVGDALEEVPRLSDDVDLVVTNPAFSLTLKLLPKLLAKVRAGGFIVLLGLNELGSRGGASRDLWDLYPPFEQWRIFGTLRFRNGINPDTGRPWGTDMRSYSWWVWRADGRGGALPLDIHDPTARRTVELPKLPAPLRRWTVIPGREDPCDAVRASLMLA